MRTVRIWLVAYSYRGGFGRAFVPLPNNVKELTSHHVEAAEREVQEASGRADVCVMSMQPLQAVAVEEPSQ